MRNIMILASFVVLAMTANAQGRFDDRRDSAPYERGKGNKYGHYKNGKSGYDNYGNINSYQREARQRIAWGIENGTITANEAKKLLKEAERIEMKENRFLRDRQLDNWERQELADDLAALNRKINRESRDWNRQSNDDRRRGYARNGY